MMKPIMEKSLAASLLDTRSRTRAGTQPAPKACTARPARSISMPCAAAIRKLASV